jgi:hypothetical protein
MTGVKLPKTLKEYNNTHHPGGKHMSKIGRARVSPLGNKNPVISSHRMAHALKNQKPPVASTLLGTDIKTSQGQEEVSANQLNAALGRGRQQRAPPSISIMPAIQETGLVSQHIGAKVM